MHVIPWIAIAVLLTSGPLLAQQTVSVKEVLTLINEQRCTDARLKIQNAPNRDEFLRTAEGKAYYACTICYSPPNQINVTDINNALLHAAAARRELGDQNRPLVSWVGLVEGNCQTLKQQLARGIRDSHLSQYSGKIMSDCRHTAPSLLPFHGDPNSDLAILGSYSWTPIVRTPELGTSTPESAVKPSQRFLEVVHRDHAVPNPRVAICAPFLALSTTQDPQLICESAQKFYQHFVSTYNSRELGGWIVLHHYASMQSMDTHIQRHEGPRCSGTLGYYDWRKQNIAFRAVPGSMGTLQHELTHALVFWDFPLAPRWLEEGMAALYENTDSGFRGLPNPWREEVLRRSGDPTITLSSFSRILSMSALEFESDVRHATISREVMCRIQQRGGLPSLYEDIRSEAKRREYERDVRADPLKEEDPKKVDTWKQLLESRF